MKQREQVQPWVKRGDEDLVDCQVFRVMRRKLYHPGRQTEGEFYIIGSRPWVNVLALTPNGHVVLVRQYRYGSEQMSVEPPGGMFEEGESPIEAGERELYEETGYRGKNARIIGQVHPNPAILNNICYFVLVEDARKEGETEWDEHEEMDILTVPWQEALAMAAKGEITHSLAVCALFYLQQELLTRQ
jgi:ADP-ribose pyrophosphatase